MSRPTAPPADDPSAEDPPATRRRPGRRLVLAAAAGLAVLALGAPVEARTSAPATAPTSLTGGTNRSVPTCQGRPATIVGEPGEDVTGTAWDDVIVAVGPDIEVWANQGNDLVCIYGPAGDAYGHAGYNKVLLSAGHDTVITYAGNNDIYGDDGNDRAYLNGGSEWLEMGEGDDVVIGLGADSVAAYGGPGWDRLTGSAGDDHLFGEDGYDVLRGAGGDDVVVGGTGNDTLHGDAGWDFLDGEDHVDECRDHQGAEGATFEHCETVVQTPAAAVPEAA